MNTQQKIKSWLLPVLFISLLTTSCGGGAVPQLPDAINPDVNIIQETPHDESPVIATESSDSLLQYPEDLVDLVRGDNADQPMIKVSIRDAANRNAICNDGSPAAFYYRPGSGIGAHRWVVYLQGGGDCSSNEKCDERHRTDPEMMTSKTLKATKVFSGILTTDPANNPDFHKANQIYLHYCSSDQHYGDREASSETGGRHFRGRQIVKSLFEDLLTRSSQDLIDSFWSDSETKLSASEKESLQKLIGNGSLTMNDADLVILSGSSAGGSGVLHNTDAVAQQIPDHIHYRSYSDAVWLDLINMQQALGDFESLLQSAEEKAAYHGRALHEGCVEDLNNEGRDIRECHLSEFGRHVRSSNFITGSQFDHKKFQAFEMALELPEYQGGELENLWTDANKSGAFNPDSELGLMLIDSAYEGFNSVKAEDGFFSPYEIQHVMLVETFWWEHEINGTSAAKAFGNWLFNRQGDTRLFEAKP